MIKKITTLGIILTIFFSFTFPSNVASQDYSDLKNPGITPDSFWYVGEIIKERLVLIFTFDKVSKVNKYLDYSNERIAETQVMIEAENYREAIVALDEYISLMRRAEGTARIMEEDQLSKIKYQANQETGNQIYHLNQIRRSTTDSLLKPKVEEAKYWIDKFRKTILNN